MPRLRLPARTENIGRFRDLLMNHAAQAGLSPEQCFDLDVVLEELVVNVASYAYGDSGGDVEIECGPYRSEDKGPCFRVVFRDWGSPFNPLDAATPDMDADDAARSQGGFGIHLVRHKVDLLSYDRVRDKNELTLALALGQRDKAASPAPSTSPGLWGWFRKLFGRP